MNSKVGMFSILIVGVMMLLVPSTSLANAQEYYEQDQYYPYEDEQYKKEDERNTYYNDDKQYKKNDKSDEPVIIIKNEPIVKKEKKKMKEPQMLIVKKEILFCDFIANGTNNECGFPGPIPGPNSGRYVQECTTPVEGGGIAACNNVNDKFFKMIVTDDIEFPGSEEGTKLNFNGERYTVTEEIDPFSELDSACKEVGFDGGFGDDVEGAGFVLFCNLFEGQCTGILQEGELKECTVKNYVVNADPF